MFVFPLVTYAVTGSALLAGVAGGLDLLGMAIALLPGGLLADRAHRRRVMRAASGAGVLLYASLVVAGVLGALTVPHLFVGRAADRRLRRACSRPPRCPRCAPSYRPSSCRPR